MSLSRVGKYTFDDSDLDRPVEVYTDASLGGTDMHGDRSPAGICLRFRPAIRSKCGALVEGLSIRFGRVQDAQLAVEALKKAGFTTARQLASDERMRIIGEAMQW